MMLKLLVVALAVAAVAADLDTDWTIFKAKYNKKYTQEENAIRKFIWTDNMKYVEEHNKLYAKGLSTFYLGENEHADKTTAEFVSQMNGMKVEVNYESKKSVSFNITSLPDTVDWRAKGYVTPIKNQKNCGSCWAFSAIGCMEGQHFKATGDLVSLSEQNILDCTTKMGGHGCDGGFMDIAFKYSIKTHGIDTEKSYPYEAADDSCRFKTSNVGATFSSYKDITKGSETDLQQAIAEVGPISVAIDAGLMSFHMYKGGVYNDPRCSSTRLNHGVLAVGYGTEDSSQYYLVKNSWGTTWGEKGYIKMSRNRNNQCGIATLASYILV